MNLSTPARTAHWRCHPGVELGEYTWNDAGLMTSDSANLLIFCRKQEKAK